MRGFLQVMAWVVMILGALSSFLGVVGALAAIGMAHASGGAMMALLLNNGFGSLARLAECVALGVGLLFLLDVDRRLRSGDASRVFG